MASEGLHEDAGKLRPATVDRHRAITSIKEELEAVDWYDQRVDVADDPDLAAILGHNRDEEKEHAAMTLEWLRRHDPTLDRHLRTYLFTTGSVLETEVAAEHGAGDGAAATRPADGSLGIGSLQNSGLTLTTTPQEH